MMLVVGEAGYGKTVTIRRYALKNDGVYLRGRPKMTPHQVLTDLVKELGDKPAYRTDHLVRQATRYFRKNIHIQPHLVQQDRETFLYLVQVRI